MPMINIPIGSVIKETEKDIIKIKLPSTKFWVIGEKTNDLWNIYLIDPQTKRQMILKSNVSTHDFSVVSSLVLKTPLPYQGKNKENTILVKRFIKKIIKTKTNGNSKKRDFSK